MHEEIPDFEWLPEDHVNGAKWRDRKLRENLQKAENKLKAAQYELALAKGEKEKRPNRHSPLHSVRWASDRVEKATSLRDKATQALNDHRRKPQEEDPTAETLLAMMPVLRLELKKRSPRARKMLVWVNESVRTTWEASNLGDGLSQAFGIDIHVWTWRELAVDQVAVSSANRQVKGKIWMPPGKASLLTPDAIRLYNTLRKAGSDPKEAAACVWEALDPGNIPAL
jgi:hypothetical protein